MLNTPAPFPEVGSWALCERLGVLEAVRIVDRADSVGLVGISFPTVPSSSGAFRTLPERLVDATPLTPEEGAEFDALAAYLQGLEQPERSTKAPRFEALRLRIRHARQLVDRLHRINAHRALATPATREAERHFAAAIGAASPAQRKVAA